MAKIAFSDVGLRSISPPPRGQTSYWDERLPSFGVRVSQGGSKTFVLNRNNSLITIGRFPIITLSEARTEAKRLLAEFTLGKVRPQSVTYSAAVELFLEEKTKARRARTVKDYKRLLERFGFKGPLLDLTHDELQRRIKKFTAPSEYNHLLVALRIFCNWCIKRRYIEHNPTVGLSTHARKRRARILSDAEIKLIWDACETGGTDLPFNYTTIVKLLILTGQRKTEMASLSAAYYSHNQQTICLPSELTKNKREHTFPLSSMASLLLRPLVDGSDGKCIFGARGSDGGKPFNGWSKSKAALDKLSGTSGWTLHDIRRTFRTNLGKIGVAPYIAERMVNHLSAQTDMEQTYDQWKYLPEMRQAVDLWEARLIAILR